jgi:hypothetical protein
LVPNSRVRFVSFSVASTERHAPPRGSSSSSTYSGRSAPEARTHRSPSATITPRGQ